MSKRWLLQRPICRFGMVNSFMEHYVYAFLRLNGTPYYISKGKGKRAWKEKQYTLRKAELKAEMYKHYLRYQQVKLVFEWIDEYLDE